MRITIVQSEIELAIREYLGRLLTVADGATMNIELAATRGAEGFKADIDIVPGARSNYGASSPPLPVKTPISPIVPTTKEAEKLVEPIEVTTAEDNIPLEAGPIASSGEPEVTEATKITSTTESNSETTPAPSRSLFKGLNKPKNN